jgi:hypothetical protein
VSRRRRVPLGKRRRDSVELTFRGRGEDRARSKKADGDGSRQIPKAPPAKAEPWRDPALGEEARAHGHRTPEAPRAPPGAGPMHRPADAGAARGARGGPRTRDEGAARQTPRARSAGRRARQRAKRGRCETQRAFPKFPKFTPAARGVFWAALIRFCPRNASSASRSRRAADRSE